MRCNICSSETELIKNIKNNTNYFFCKECDFIFIDKNKILPENLEKNRYLKHNNTFDNIGYVEKFKNLINKYVICYKNNIKDILDFGCGYEPVLAKLLKENGFLVDIYDKYFSPEKVFLNKKYDLITLIEVIEHFKEPLLELMNLKKHLNKNGFFIIETLFHPGDKVKFLKWWYKEDLTHVSFFTLKTFKKIVELLNMRIVDNNDKDICILQANH